MEGAGRSDRLTLVLVLVMTGAIVMQNFLTIRVMRQVEALTELITSGGGRIEGGVAEMDGPAVGEVAPAFAYLDTENRTRTRESLAGKPALLVFSSPTCKYCKLLYPELRRLATDDTARGLQILVLQIDATPEQNRLLRQKEDLPFQILSVDRQSFAAYEVPGTPFSVLLDEEGKVVRTGTVNSFERLVEFVRS